MKCAACNTSTDTYIEFHNSKTLKSSKLHFCDACLDHIKLLIEIAIEAKQFSQQPAIMEVEDVW